MALNRRTRHGKARILGEVRSRQPMLGAAVHDPKQTSISPVTGLAMQAKQSIDFRGY